jgi:hypothetical protein
MIAEQDASHLIKSAEAGVAVTIASAIPAATINPIFIANLPPLARCCSD